MDWHKRFCWIIIIVGLGILSQFIFGPDNPIEQGVEEIIKKEYNIDVDLSPAHT